MNNTHGGNSGQGQHIQHAVHVSFPIIASNVVVGNSHVSSPNIQVVEFIEFCTLIGAHNSDFEALRSKLRSEILGENPESVSNDCTIGLCYKLNQYMNDTKPADKDLTKPWVSFHRRSQVSSILFHVNNLYEFYGLDIQAENNEGMDLNYDDLKKCQESLKIIKRLIEVTIQDIEKDYDYARGNPLSLIFSPTKRSKVYPILKEYTSNRERIDRQQNNEIERHSLAF